MPLCAQKSGLQLAHSHMLWACGQETHGTAPEAGFVQRHHDVDPQRVAHRGGAGQVRPVLPDAVAEPRLHGLPVNTATGR